MSKGRTLTIVKDYIELKVKHLLQEEKDTVGKYRALKKIMKEGYIRQGKENQLRKLMRRVSKCTSKAW